MPDFDRYACLLLSPDFAYHGDAGALTSLLDALGTDVLVAACVRLAPPDLTALYQGRVTHADRVRNSDSVWLSRRLYSLGPATCLVLRARAPGPPLAVRLKERKGSSLRGQAAAGTLRAMSPRVDRCFSLVHCADDTAGMLADLAILLGKDARQFAFEPREPLPAWCFASLCPGCTAGPAHPLALPAGIVAKVLALTAADPWGGRATALEGALLAAAVCGRLEAQPESVAAPRDVLALLGPALDRARSLAARSDWPGPVRPDLSPELRRLLLQGLLQAFGSGSLELTRSEQLLQLLDYNGIALGVWESQRLLCLSAFD